MKKKCFRVLSMILATVMLLMCVPLNAIAVDTETDFGDLLLYLSFDNTSTGFAGGIGKAVCGQSVNLVDGKYGKAMSFDGTSASKLTLTTSDGKSLIGTNREFTISYWSQTEKTMGGNWSLWINASGKNANARSYIGVLDGKDKIQPEMGSKYGSAAEISTGTDWKFVTLSVNDTSLSLYVNGEEVKSLTGSSVETILGDNSEFYIGFAGWNTGEFYKGFIDEFSVYSKAADKDAVKTLYNEALNDNELKRAAASIELNGVTNGEVYCDKLEDGKIDLPSTAGEDGDIAVTWSSSDEEVIASDGTVKLSTSAAEAKSVTLTATLTKGEDTYEKEFAITVYPSTIPDDFIISADDTALSGIFNLAEKEVGTFETSTGESITASGAWGKKKNGLSNYKHSNGKDYSFTNSFNAGQGGKDYRRYIKFHPEQACIVTAVFNGGLSLTVEQDGGEKNTLEPDTNKTYTAVVLDVENPNLGDVYIYGGSNSKDLWAVFVEYYDPDVVVNKTLSGNIKYSGENENLKLMFVDQKDNTEYTTPLINGEYSIELRQARNYDIKVVDENNKVSEVTTVSLDTNSVYVPKADKTFDIDVLDIVLTEVTGDVVVRDYRTDVGTLDLSKVTLTFTAQDDATKTYTATINDKKLSVKMMPGHIYDVTAEGNDGYIFSDLSKTYTMQAGETNPTKSVLFEKNISGADYEATLEVGKDKNFNKISDAVAYASAMNRPEGEDGRVTILVDSGEYIEQINVTSPYITIKGTDPNNRPIIKWYYAEGYQYYSAGGNGYYSMDYAVAKIQKKSGATWACATRIAADYVNFENLIVFNTASCYVVEEEFEDGEEPTAENVTAPDRSAADFDPLSSVTKGRSAAIVAAGNYCEIYNSDFIGSQDSFYTGGILYVKNSYIEGETDFIYGGTNVIFDDCTVAVHGWSDKKGGAQITACKSNGEGYLFRNTTIRNSKYFPTNQFDVAGWGRNWGGADCQVIFDGVKMEDATVPSSWSSMGAELSKSVLYVNNVTDKNGNSVNVSNTKLNPNGTMEDNNFTVKADSEYFNNWIPAHYSSELPTETSTPTEAPVSTTAPTEAPVSTTAPTEEPVSTTAPTQKPTTDNENLILKLTFDDTKTGFAGGIGKASYDKAPNLVDDAINGKAMKFTGKVDSKLTVTKEDGSSLMAGLDEFTITYWSKMESIVSKSWTVWINNKDCAASDRKYVGILDRGNQLRGEFTNGSKSPNIEAAVDSLGEWKFVAMTISKSKGAVLYENGKKIGEYTKALPLGDMLGTAPTFNIGYAGWNEYFTGTLDEFSVYSKALTANEINEIYRESGDWLALVGDGLEIPELYGESLYCDKFTKLTLPTKDNSGAAEISIAWTDDKGIISSDGTINQPSEITQTVLKATLSDGERSIMKEFNITVIPKGKSIYSMNIDLDNEGVDISQQLIGLFYEDISASADGGLAPEQIKNNSFENYINIQTVYETPHGDETTWKRHWYSSGSGKFNVISDAATGINENNSNYARLTGNVTLKNYGYAPNKKPQTASIAIKKGRKFDFNVWTRADSDYSGEIKVKVVNASGKAITNEEVISFTKDGKWNKSENVVLIGTADEKGIVVFEVTGADSSQVLDVDMVSLSPQDTYGYGNINYARGKGLRADLVEALMELKPGFIRFPGGCIIEGNMGHNSYYNWENSIGPLEERKANSNHWIEKYDAETTGYMQSYELGYHEILQLCEDMNAEAFPILSAGVFCQMAKPDGGEKDSFPAATGEELTKFANHAVHLIDYCWGDPNSTNETQAYWAKKRVENGHSEPFKLNYIGIGNENWGENKYWPNFDYIKDYIDEFVKDNYPGRTITVISSAGSSAEGSAYRYAYKHLGQKYAGQTLVDEHYYVGKDFMLSKDSRYDFYTRLEDGGSNAFVGEYALKEEKKNDLKDAIGEAAYMTGFERNADIVRHASYAPLLARYNLSTWSPNLIWFDDYSVVRTPNYYVQKMYSENYGTKVVNSTLNMVGKMYDKNYGSPIIATNKTAGTATYIKVTRSDGKILLEDNFTVNGENTAGMKWESMSGEGFSIKDGKMSIDKTSGYNIIWLPDAAQNPEWYDYTVEVKTTATSNGSPIIVGVGAVDKKNYYLYNIGTTESQMMMARTGLDLSRIGNNYENSYKSIVNAGDMTVTVVYGVDGAFVGEFETAANGKVARNFAAKVRPYQNEIYQVCSKDDDYIYLKLINTDDYNKPISLNFEGQNNSDVEIICLKGDGSEINSVGDEKVAPTAETTQLNGSVIEYTIPSMSFSVLKVARTDNASDIEYNCNADGTLSVNVPYENGVLVAAKYNGNVLESTQSVNINKAGEYKFENMSNGDKIKLFVWDSLDTMQPLTKSVKVNFKANN